MIVALLDKAETSNSLRQREGEKAVQLNTFLIACANVRCTATKCGKWQFHHSSLSGLSVLFSLNWVKGLYNVFFKMLNYLILCISILYLWSLAYTMQLCLAFAE